MLTKLKKRAEGFTIIEVLIVLAIAGLILLIVFLAVPALQRNSRNTTLKNDAASIAGGVSEYASNNNGTTPTTFTKTAEKVAITGGGTVAAEAKVNGGDTVNTAAAIPGTIAASTIVVVPGVKCDGSSSSRAVAIAYAIEKPSGTPGVGCLDS